MLSSDPVGLPGAVPSLPFPRRECVAHHLLPPYGGRPAWRRGGACPRLGPPGVGRRRGGRGAGFSGELGVRAPEDALCLTRDGGREFVGNAPKRPPMRVAGADRLAGRVVWHGTRSGARANSAEDRPRAGLPTSTGVRRGVSTRRASLPRKGRRQLLSPVGVRDAWPAQQNGPRLRSRAAGTGSPPGDPMGLPGAVPPHFRFLGGSVLRSTACPCAPVSAWRIISST